jgi:macrolide transport system ATP-binding/permease protein
MQLRVLLEPLFRRDPIDQSMDEEMNFHIEERAADLRRSGVPAEEAKRRAKIEFGGTESYKEQCRDARPFQWVHGFFSDLRFGMRMLRRSPGFSILAILCLTVGIGANAAVFGWIEGTLYRPYPLVSHEERLFVLAGTARGVNGYDPTSWPDLLDFQRDCKLIDAFIAEHIVGTTLSIGDRAQHAVGSLVSANYFDALGIRPVLGRGFQPGEDTGRNAYPVVVISYQLWQDRFHGDRSVIGKTQIMNGMPHTIVGVAPKGFYGTFVGYAWQFWVPASMQERFDSTGYQLEDRGARWVEGFVRLKPGVSAQQAQQEITAVARRLETDFPDTNRGRGIKLLPLWESPFNATDSMRPTLKITALVVFFVLIIACANVSNLLLVRAFARRHELTLRMAVGAGRARLIKQLLTESLVLAGSALVGAILVAHWCRNLLVLLVPPRSGPIFMKGELDWRVLALSAGVCVLSILLFGMIPAFQTSNLDVSGALKCESAGVIGTRGKSRLRSALILLQVALSFVLLVGAGLLLKSVQRIRNTSPGFSSDGVLISGINLVAANYDQQRAKTFQDELLNRVQNLAGVDSAAYARVVPFSYLGYSSAPIAVDGYQAAPDEQPTANYDEVSPAFFSTIGMPLLSGRDFTPADDENAAPVVIVNEAMAAQYWRGWDPVGMRLQVKGRSMRVIGVAKNAKYENMLETPTPFFYVPLSQNPSSDVALLVRTRQDPSTLGPALAREVRALDANVAPLGILTMREQISRQTLTQQVAGRFLGIFGGLALLLATIGLYGVMSYTVSQSARELGLRVALGAAPSHLLRLVMSRGLALIGLGLAIGFVAALATTRLFGYLLWGVSPHDPLSFGSALAIIGIASMAACFLPAWRATRTDPLRALRD